MTYLSYKKEQGTISNISKELDRKYKTSIFEYKISSQKIPFLYRMVYKDKDNNLQTILYCKPTD